MFFQPAGFDAALPSRDPQGVQQRLIDCKTIRRLQQQPQSTKPKERLLERTKNDTGECSEEELEVFPRALREVVVKNRRLQTHNLPPGCASALLFQDDDGLPSRNANHLLQHSCTKSHRQLDPLTLSTTSVQSSKTAVIRRRRRRTDTPLRRVQALRRELYDSEASKQALDSAILANFQWTALHCCPGKKECFTTRTADFCRRWAAEKIWGALSRIVGRLAQSALQKWRHTSALATRALAARHYVRTNLGKHAVRLLLARIERKQRRAFARWKKEVDRVLAIERNQAALTLQTRLCRLYLARRRVHKRHLSIVVSQSVLRRALASKRVTDIRRHKAEVDRAASCIVSNCRNRIECRNAKQQLTQLRKKQAANRIQSCARGAAAKREAKRLCGERARLIRHRRASGAVAAQKVVRAHLARYEAQNRKDATKTLQAAQRCRAARHCARRKSHAGSTLNRTARGTIARRTARKERQRINAATKISAAARRYFITPPLVNKLRESKARARVAMRLQARWRGHDGRQQFAELRRRQQLLEASLRLQCWTRQQRAVKIVEKLRERKVEEARIAEAQRQHACCLIQTHCRRLSASQRVNTMRQDRFELRQRAAVRVQSYQRSVAQRRRYTFLRDEARHCRELDRFNSAVAIQKFERRRRSVQKALELREEKLIASATQRHAEVLSGRALKDALRIALRHHRASISVQSRARGNRERAQDHLRTRRQAARRRNASIRIQSRARANFDKIEYKRRMKRLESQRHQLSIRIQARVRGNHSRADFHRKRHQRKMMATPMPAPTGQSSSLPPSKPIRLSIDEAARRIQTNVRSQAARYAFKRRREVQRDAVRALTVASAEATDIVKSVEVALANDVAGTLALFHAPAAISEEREEEEKEDMEEYDVVLSAPIDRDDGAVQIQKIFRGLHARRVGMLQMCRSAISSAIASAEGAAKATEANLAAMWTIIEAYQRAMECRLQNQVASYHASATKLQALHRGRVCRQRFLARRTGASYSLQSNGREVKADIVHLNADIYPTEHIEAEKDLSVLIDVSLDESSPPSTKCVAMPENALKMSKISESEMDNVDSSGDIHAAERIEAEKHLPVPDDLPVEESLVSPTKCVAVHEDASTMSKSAESEVEHVETNADIHATEHVEANKDLPKRVDSPSGESSVLLAKCVAMSEDALTVSESSAPSTIKTAVEEAIPTNGSSVAFTEQKKAVQSSPHGESEALIQGEQTSHADLQEDSVQQSEVSGITVSSTAREVELVTESNVIETTISSCATQPSRAINDGVCESKEQCAPVFRTQDESTMPSNPKGLISSPPPQQTVEVSAVSSTENDLSLKNHLRPSNDDLPPSESHVPEAKSYDQIEAAATALAEKVIEEKVAVLESRMSELAEREARLASLEASVEARLAAATSAEADRMAEMAAKLESELSKRVVEKLSEHSHNLEAKFAEQALVKADDDEDWIAYYDDASGANYYYNAKTNETSWELPPGAKVTPGDALTPRMASPSSYSQSGDELSFENIDRPPQQSWLEYWDESAGARYWYNVSTHEASWTRPVQDDDDDGDLLSSVLTDEPPQPIGPDWSAISDNESQGVEASSRPH